MGIILFPLSIGFGLICRTWAFLITHNRPLGRADWAFILHPGLSSQRLERLNGHAQRIGPLSWAGVKRPKCFNGHASLVGVSEWACEPIFQTLSLLFDFIYRSVLFFSTSGFLVSLLYFVFRCFKSIKEPTTIGVGIWGPFTHRRDNPKFGAWTSFLFYFIYFIAFGEPCSAFGFIATNPPSS